MLSIMMCIYVTSLYIDESQRSLKCSSSSKILMLTLDSTPTLPKIPTSEFRQRSADDMIARYLVLSRFDRKDSTTCTSWAAIEDWNKLFFPNATVFDELSEFSQMLYFEDFSAQFKNMCIDSSSVRRTDQYSRLRDFNRRKWTVDKEFDPLRPYNLFYVIQKQVYYRSKTTNRSFGPRTILLQLQLVMDEYGQRCQIVEIRPYQVEIESSKPTKVHSTFPSIKNPLNK